MSELDCGDNSCKYTTKRGGMRTNGGCRCSRNHPQDVERHLLRANADLTSQLSALKLELEKVKPIGQDSKLSYPELRKTTGIDYGLLIYPGGNSSMEGHFVRADMAQDLQTKLTDANAEITRLRGALEFYADKENWGSDDKSRTTGNKSFDIILFDFDRNLKLGEDYGGKRAREALKAAPKVKD